MVDFALCLALMKMPIYNESCRLWTVKNDKMANMLDHKVWELSTRHIRTILEVKDGPKCSCGVEKSIKFEEEITFKIKG